jgi:ATP-dependent DNA helicase RecG
MQVAFLETPVEFLKGVGPAKAELLGKELNIRTIGDLLTLFPFRYIDRSKFFLINEIKDENTYIQLRAKLVKVQLAGAGRGQRLVVTVRDSTGEIELVWFQGIKWVTDRISAGQEYIIFGKPSLYNGKWNIAHPELEIPSHTPVPISEMLRPIYPSTEKLKARGLDYKGIGRLVKTVLLHERFTVPENLSADILNRLKLLGRQDAFINIHYPVSQEMLKKAQNRLKFEELFYIQLRLANQRNGRLQQKAGHRFVQVGEYVNRFFHQHLKFELTGAQKKVIREIRTDLGSGTQMNRLLQGDVGSGKTLVALMTMLIGLDNQYQCSLMAPTEILAKQHYSTITGMLENMGVSVALLMGSTRPAERRKIHEGLQSGEIQILIGTHALLEDDVKFHNLGLVVIDEQHRFGVAQRARMRGKNDLTPHILVMTATPIPRTLAMTLYGDLDVSVIDELPPGRKPVITKHIYEADQARVYHFIREKISEGRQVYMVYPLIQESETLDLKNLMEGYQHIVAEFPPPSYRVSMVHGKMKQLEKDAGMREFIEGRAQILVATTVIEVGVDVPNASVMVIENAQRFGLSQLHQLRGRVGRGADQSYCILMSNYELSAEARKRLATMVRTANGFEIAEADLQLRGPGDLQGTQQSGIVDLKIADILKDEKMIRYARNLAGEIIAGDPGLLRPENDILARHLKSIDRNAQNWGLIA